MACLSQTKTDQVSLTRNAASLYRLLWREYYVHRTLFTGCSSAGVPNLGDARGLKVVFTWVHLYQCGDADTKRLGTPALEQDDDFASWQTHINKKK